MTPRTEALDGIQAHGAHCAERIVREGYGRFPEHLERDWLGRWCHLSEAEVTLFRRRDEETTRLGSAAQPPSS